MRSKRRSVSGYTVPRKPARAFAADPDQQTSLRVTGATASAMHQIRDTLVEWLLTHGDREVRASALNLSIDHALRVVLATFARDYHIPLSTERT